MANTSFSAASIAGSGTLTNANLTFASTSGVASVHSPDYRDTGDFYFEITFNVRANASTQAGLATPNYNNAGGTEYFTVSANGQIWCNGVNTGVSLGALADGDVIGFAGSLGKKLVFARKGATGNWNGSATANPATYAGGITFNGIAYVSPFARAAATNDRLTLNAGDTAFAGAVPAGYTPGWPAPGESALIPTQISGEVFASVPAELRVSQLALEVWRSTADTHAASLLVTQLGVQVWASVANAPPPSTTRRRRPILVSSFGPAP